jgi:hypothetical protein
MENEQVELIRTHVIRYACGCTTTRIEACLGPQDTYPNCAGHNAQVIHEETVTEFKRTCEATHELKVMGVTNDCDR